MTPVETILVQWNARSQTFKKYFLIGVGVLLLVLILWYFVYPKISTRWLNKAQVELSQIKTDLQKAHDENIRVQGEYNQSQEAIKSLSQKIMDLRKEADKQGVIARQANDRANEHAKASMILTKKIAELEAARKSKQPVTSLGEAKREIDKFINRNTVQ